LYGTQRGSGFENQCRCLARAQLSTSPTIVRLVVDHEVALRTQRKQVVIGVSIFNVLERLQ